MALGRGTGTIDGAGRHRQRSEQNEHTQGEEPTQTHAPSVEPPVPATDSDRPPPDSDSSGTLGLAAPAGPGVRGAGTRVSCDREEAGAVPSLQPADEFAGYRILRRLGAGGMGTGHLDEHPRLPHRD